MKLEAFLKVLTQTLHHSSHAYLEYMNAGKTFQFARQLKHHNSKALELLTENKSLLTDDLKKDAEALIIHYTQWSQKWEKLAAEKDHQPDDVFVFANEVTFPRQAAKNIEDACQGFRDYHPIP